MAIKPRLLWTCVSLPVATHPNKHSCAEGEDLWRGEKAIIGQTQRGEPRRRAKNTSRSLGERQREVIQIERRCLIWHGAPLRHLISFNPCGRWKQGEELALPGEETTNLPQLATESLVCVCCWVTDSHLSVLWMSLTHKSLIPYNIRNVFTFKNTERKKRNVSVGQNIPHINSVVYPTQRLTQQRMQRKIYWAVVMAHQSRHFFWQWF